MSAGARDTDVAPGTTPCEKCSDDGYTEVWNDDQTGVVIELCDCAQGQRIDRFDVEFAPHCDEEGL